VLQRRARKEGAGSALAEHREDRARRFRRNLIAKVQRQAGRRRDSGAHGLPEKQRGAVAHTSQSPLRALQV